MYLLIDLASSQLPIKFSIAYFYSSLELRYFCVKEQISPVVQITNMFFNCFILIFRQEFAINSLLIQNRNKVSLIDVKHDSPRIFPIGTRRSERRILFFLYGYQESAMGSDLKKLCPLD